MAAPSPPSPSQITADDPIHAVETATQHLARALSAQWIDLRGQGNSCKIERRTFSRFLINDPSSWKWKRGDDFIVTFLTDDSEGRWAEVVTEALEIEVKGKDLQNATKLKILDLTDERVCRFRDGSRTKYWYLKNSHPANARVIVHYSRLGPDWGGRDLTALLQQSNGLSPWPGSTQSYGQVPPPPSPPPPGVELDIPSPWTSSQDKTFSPYGYSQVPPPPPPPPNGEDEASARPWRRLTTSETSPAPEPRQASAHNSPFPPGQPAPPSHSPPASSSGQRFRDAHSALSRLRYDPAHANTQYDVGYEDRFEGMRWMPLAEWGGKGTEEEDFIPEHRVKRILRARDGVCVWDREKRVDRTGETPGR